MANKRQNAHVPKLHKCREGSPARCDAGDCHYFSSTIPCSRSCSPAWVLWVPVNARFGLTESLDQYGPMIDIVPDKEHMQRTKVYVILWSWSQIFGFGGFWAPLGMETTLEGLTIRRGEMFLNRQSPFLRSLYSAVPFTRTPSTHNDCQGLCHAYRFITHVLHGA